ncbi:pappalysin-1 [Protopterus annectens]|uniref:pappalysin-1 n=1 Tax=Protopterus annectens TaxID=7888 RepID=UPI001CF9C233|nr:pappalysin-1 [Protopterus annectens]
MLFGNLAGRLPLFITFLVLTSDYWATLNLGESHDARRIRREVKQRPSDGSSTSSPGMCATRLPRGKRSLFGLSHSLHYHQHRQRHRGILQHPEEEQVSNPGKMLYFTGHRDQMKLRPGIELPRGQFSAEMWIQPEGGQQVPAVLAGLYNKCTYTAADSGWVLGINAVRDKGTREPHFFFSLRTERAHKNTTIFSHQSYLSNQWTHVAITYNLRKMKLYINGAQVAVSDEQVGDLFTSLTRKCKILMIGGNTAGQNYRGYLERFILWKEARTAKQILHDMKQFVIGETTLLPQLVLKDNFSNIIQYWLPTKDGKYPQTEVSFHNGWLLDTGLQPPPCGQTICDNVNVITNYNNMSSFRHMKVVRYRVVNIYDDNHQHPMVTDKQITFQHEELVNAFRRYNISWELTVVGISNSSLRNRLVLVNCDISKIGDDRCDIECNHTLTGYDGGDCLRVRRVMFYNKGVANGVCDMENNNERYNFDGGDCCNAQITDVTKTCFDPKSPNRAYLDIKEVKNILRLDGSTHLNIFFANCSDEELAGVATWPWDKDALTHLGGIVLSPSVYGVSGHTDTMIHEIGHSLGLYHVFKGISEVLSCSDPCMEVEPSFETGDLCADTNPVPKLKMCNDPGPGNETCGFVHFKNTPFRSYMSYADNVCTNSFTPNQVARMHCYLDLVYKTWQTSKKPAPVPIAPQIVHRDSSSLTLEWFPPLDNHFYESELGENCNQCLEDRVFLQYAFNASSKTPCDPAGHWSPSEAEGPPDADQFCKSSIRTWSPNYSVGPNIVPPICPEPIGCYLELHFRYPLIPESLTVWVTYVSVEVDVAIHDIRLLTVKGNNISLGPQKVFCDIPLTIKLSISEEVYGIEIYTLDEYLEIDAAMLVSVPQSHYCSRCKPIKYKIIRHPPFQHGRAVMIRDLRKRFRDMDVKLSTLYTYQVFTVSGQEESQPSPSLVYEHGKGYCGDGVVQQELGEECDDQNKMNGDGCTFLCKLELSFHCVDEPSMCYFHDGDGICEEFERKTSFKDCGVYTPNGFLDQWAFNISTSHQHEVDCPGSVVIGQPAAFEGCRTEVSEFEKEVSQYAWYPCIAHSLPESYKLSSFWLKAYFAQPAVAVAVIIHFVADGTQYPYPFPHQEQESITVQLLDTNGKSHDLGSQLLSCRNNPLVITVIHDLSQPFYRTRAVLISFRSKYVAISGVALRSFHNFDPITVRNCQNDEIYSPDKQSCIQYSCEATDCQELIIKNAEINCTIGDFTNREQCNVTCTAGYTLHIHRDGNIAKSQVESTASVMCLDGKWNMQVICEPVDCGIPNPYHVYPSTFSCPNGTILGKQCTFQCKPPAQMRGTNNTLTCMEDGLWSFPEAHCELMCTAPPHMPNAILQTARCHSGRHKVGSFCKYKCEPGFLVSSSPKTVKKRAFKILCTDSATWHGDTCEHVTCDPPPDVFHGVYECTNGFIFNSICWINCNDTEHTVPSSNRIRCRKDGKWSGSLRVCKTMQGECPPIPRFRNLNFTCMKGYGIGAECEPVCPEKNTEPVVLPSNMTIKDVTYLMKPPKVKKIVCTAGLQWYHSPQTIHCLRSCENFPGDNYCDAINNRAFCDFDGGDCCASTVKTKKDQQPSKISDEFKYHRSSFMPPINHHVPMFQQAMLKELHFHSRSIPPLSNKVSKTCMENITNLANNHELVIIGADKGGSIVVQDISQYDHEAFSQLSNARYYSELSMDPTPIF